MSRKPSQHKTACSLEACLEYLRAEAEEQGLLEVAHLIGVAALAAHDAAWREPASDARPAKERPRDEARRPAAAPA